MSERNILVYDELGPALLGYAVRCGKDPIAVYDFELAVKTLVDRDGSAEEDAREYLEFNYLGGWIGEGTPLFLMRSTRDELDELADELFG